MEILLTLHIDKLHRSDKINLWRQWPSKANQHNNSERSSNSGAPETTDFPCQKAILKASLCPRLAQPSLRHPRQHGRTAAPAASTSGWEHLHRRCRNPPLCLICSALGHPKGQERDFMSAVWHNIRIRAENQGFKNQIILIFLILAL